MVFDQSMFRSGAKLYGSMEALGIEVASGCTRQPRRHGALFEDMDARFRYIKTIGKSEADIYVISSTNATACANTQIPSHHKIDAFFDPLEDVLAQNHRNVRFGWDQFFTQPGADRFFYGNPYRAVVLSHPATLNADAIAMLTRLAQQGGIVLLDSAYPFDGAHPELVNDIKNADALKALIEHAILVTDGNWK